MSGAYVYQGDGDLQARAALLAGQLSHGGERINHYTIHDDTLLGCVSHDKFNQGFMPRFCEGEGLWGILLGELHDSDWRAARRRECGHDACDLTLLARRYRESRLFDDLPAVHGAFFFVLWDPETRALVAGNDRFGLYPMYWAHSQDRFCLAGRVLCAVLADVVPGRWDREAVAQFLATDDYVGEATLVEGVSSFPQATLLEKRGDRLTWRRYWHYDYRGDYDGDRTGLARELGDRLVRAVERQTARAKRVGVTLSGGLDSRCLVAAASRAKVPVDTFTWAKPGAFDREFARRVAETYGTRHHDCDYALENLDTRFEEGMRLTEGLIDYFDCHMLAHVDILGEHSDLILNGYAGDLILGGSYLKGWMKPMSVAELASRVFSWRNVLVPEARLGEVMSQPVAPEGLPSARFQQLLEAAQGPTPGDTVDRFVLENRVRRVTSMGTVIMRHSVESAAPFFDYDLVDLILRIPSAWRAEHRIYKEMMRNTFPEALRLPWQRTLLPAGAPSWAAVGAKAALKVASHLEARWGRPTVASRQSPASFADWLRGPLRPWLERVMLEDYPVANEVLHHEFCRNVCGEHFVGLDRTRLLGALAALRGFSEALRKARAHQTAFVVEPLEVWPPDRHPVRPDSVGSP